MASNHYVDNERLLKELSAHVTAYKAAKEAGLETPAASNYIGRCVQQIAEGLSLNRNFIGYPFREDMIYDGIENCLRYIHNFDTEKSSNPFAYLTQIIYYAFLRKIKKEKKQEYIKYKVTVNASITNQLAEMPAEDMTQFMDVLTYNDPDKFAKMAEEFEGKSVKF